MNTKDTHNMYLIEVYPIARGVPFYTLSYFSNTRFEKHRCITVPFRNQQTLAVVKESTPASNAKAKIKSADYTLQKIEKQNTVQLFSPAMIQVAESAAEYFATTPGAVLYAATPEIILADPHAVSATKQTHTNTDNAPTTETRYIQSAFPKRIREYTNDTGSQTVCFLAPTGIAAEQLYEHLKDTDKATYLLNNRQSDDQITKNWSHVSAPDTPIHIVATPGFLTAMPSTIDTLIVEKEGSDAYKQQHRPMLDWRIVAKITAETYNADRILGDTILQLSSWHTQKNTDGAASSTLKDSYEISAEQLLVDMKTHTDDTKEGFALFADPLQEAVQDASNTHILLLVGRKGIHPFTVCGDCGEVLTCDTCEAPMTLKQKDDNRVFFCTRCNTAEQSDRVCEKCGSWKLWALGVGTDRVVTHLQEKYTKKSIFQIDKDTTTTNKQAREEIEDFYNTGGILVGTQMAVPYLQDVDVTGIVSLDSQLSIPDFTINERIFRLLTHLRLRTTTQFIMQTRRKRTTVLEHALAGDVNSFFQRELEMRKQLDYPPYTTLIRISVSDFETSARSRIRDIANQITHYPTNIYPAFSNKGGTHFRMHLLIILPKNKWPDTKLSSLLQSRNTDVTVNVIPNKII